MEAPGAMEPAIRRLIVQGFRSIRSEVVDFDNPTFFVGRNGSGKSNLVDALAFLGECMTTPLRWVFADWGRRRALTYGSSRASVPGPVERLGISTVLGPIDDVVSGARYSVSIVPSEDDLSPYRVEREQCFIECRGEQGHWFDRIGSEPFRTNADGLRPQLSEDALALPLLGGDSRFGPLFETLAGIRTYAIVPDRVREFQLPDRGWNLHRDGDNAASVLRRIEENNPDDLQRIGEFLGAIVPGIERIEVKPYGPKLGLEFTQRWNGSPGSLVLEASSMSDGTLRTLGLLAAVYQRQTPSVMIIEEPEATIHPGALSVILDVLHHASERGQVIVTTHSPEVLDAEWLEDRHIRIVDWQDGETRVLPLGIRSREALRQHLMSAGELMRSNALTGVSRPSDSTPRAQLFEEALV